MTRWDGFIARYVSTPDHHAMARSNNRSYIRGYILGLEDVLKDLETLCPGTESGPELRLWARVRSLVVDSLTEAKESFDVMTEDRRAGTR